MLIIGRHQKNSVMGSEAPPSKYEVQKQRDWNTFLKYLKNHEPQLTVGGCSGADVVEFLEYLDQFGKTKVHISGCCYIGDANSSGLCGCPLKQEWGTLDSLIGRLRAAYEEYGGGQVESNPFEAREVWVYLKEVRGGQERLRGISYERKQKRQKVTPTAVATQVVDVGGGSGATVAPATTNVTVCQKCGAYGFYEALIYCVKCQVTAEHFYCLDELPEIFDENFSWACEDCVPRVAKQTTLDKPSSTSSRKSSQICLRSVPTAHSEIKLKKLNNITSSNAETEMRGHKSSPSLQPCDAHLRVDMTKSDQLIGDCSSLMEVKKNMPSCYENHGKDQKFGKKTRLICDDGGNFDEGVDDVESVKVKSSQVAACEPSKVIENNCYVPAQPIFDPIWSGSFTVYIGNFGTIDGLAAHLSNKACLKVFEIASLLPEVLHLEMLPRLDVWPKSFHRSKPTDDNIALYFFPKNQRDEKTYDILVEDIISHDLAMKTVVENAELLIFTSLELPLQYWRFQGKHYLWGIFRGNKASLLDQPKDHCFIRNSSIDAGTGEERNLTKIWDTQFPLHPLSNNGGNMEKQMIERKRSKAQTLRKCDAMWSLGPQCKRIRSKALRANPFMFNKKVVSANGPRTGALTQDGPADTGVIIDSSHQEEYAKERSVSIKTGPEGITEKETETIRNCAVAILLQEITHTIVETSMNEEVDQLVLEAQSKHMPEGLMQLEGTNKGPVNAGNSQVELSVAKGDTIRNSVVAVLPQEITHAIDETSMIEEVGQLVLKARSKQMAEGLEQLAGTSKEPVNAGTCQDELSAGNGDNIRTSFVAILPQEITHSIDETSLNEEVDQLVLKARSKQMAEGLEQPAGTSKEPVNAGTNQDELSDRNGDNIRNSLVAILPQEITHAIDETSMNEEQLAGISKGPQAVPIGATAPSAIPSAMASAPDVQESTIATQFQEVTLHTILEGTQEGEGKMESVFDELMDSDETVAVDNSLAQVGPYYVKSSMAPILRAIIDKHGDIAQDCVFQTNSMRSCALEEVCKVIQELQRIPFTHLQGHHLKSLYSAVNDAVSINLKVEWLRSRHDELKEVVRPINQYKIVKKALAKSIEAAESTKRTLDSKKAYVVVLQSEFQSLESQLASLEAETGFLDSATSKAAQFHHKSLVDGLL